MGNISRKVANREILLFVVARYLFRIGRADYKNIANTYRFTSKKMQG